LNDEVVDSCIGVCWDCELIQTIQRAKLGQ